MSAPLVNDYKKNFILKRLLETFLGGLRLYFSSAVPPYIYLIQVILFAVIPCLCGIFIHLANSGIIRVVAASLASGCITLFYSLMVQIVALFLQKQKPVKEVEQVDTFGDEEVFEFDSIFGPKTWLFLVPPKKLYCCIILHSFVAGVVGGLSVYYLHLEPKPFIWNNALRSLFTTFGIFTLSVGIWPLIVGSPPELAIFNQLPFDLQDLSRPSHMLTCILIHGIARRFTNSIQSEVDFLCLDWYVQSHDIVSLAKHDCLVHLQLHRRLSSQSRSGFDVSFLRRHRIENIPSSAAPGKSNRLRCDSKCLTKQELYVYCIVLLGILGFSLALCIPYRKWYMQSSEFDEYPVDTNSTNGTLYEDPSIPPIFQGNTIDILWGCLIFLCVLLLIIHRLQRPYVLMFFKNPKAGLLHHFNGRFFLMISYLIHCGGPFVSFLFIHILTGANLETLFFGERYTDSFCLALSYGYLFRQIWQFPEHNMISLSLFMTVEKIGGLKLATSSWGSLAVPARMHLFSLIVLWSRRALKRVKVMAMFTWTSVSEMKQRKLVNYFLLGLNIGLAPFLILIACISSVLSFPLFPLFTLPLFLVGFPRPMRFWPYPIGYSANQCSDTIYYEQIMPYVTKALHQRILSNGLGIIFAGEIFLLRWEDRLLWVQVLEVGFSYITYSFKGLELQETSCHTAEAGRVDSIFSRAYDIEFEDNRFNTFPFHSLVPLSKLTCLGYSDTRNVLTGVLDSPETLGVIKDYFSKSLIYFLLVHAHNYNGKKPYTPCSRPPTESRVSDLGSSSAITRKAFSSLPRAERVKSGSSIASASAPISDGEESQSVKSQSGRGSRLAWVDDTKVAGIISKMESRAGMQSESISEDENEIPSMRPVSWASENNSIGARHPNSFENEELRREFHPRKKSSRLETKTIVLRPVKMKSYIKLSPNDSPQNSDLREVGSDSDSETESIRNFYLKNIKKSQAKENRDKSAFGSRHSGKSKTIKPLTEANEPHHIMKMNHQESDAELKKDHTVTFDPNTKSRNRLLAYKSSLSLTLSPQLNWIVDLPCDEDCLEDLQDEFPISWFKFLLKHFGLIEIEELAPGEVESTLNSHNERLVEQLLADEFLEESYRTLIALCQMTVLGSDMGLPTANQVFRLFYGDIPNSKNSDWLKTKESLMNIVIKAYRIAVKLSLDHSLVAPINSCWSDLECALAEYNKDWYVGPDRIVTTNANASNDVLWDQAIRKETSNLFSLGFNEVKGIYTSHLLSLSETDINLGKLDDETVRSFWASLTGELLYFTNDDDERYSIQAHTVLLRNLTIQAADPPLGYPIYSSQPISIGLA